MPLLSDRLAIAFEGPRCVADGPLPDVALAVKKILARGSRGEILVFDRVTSTPIDLDLSGTDANVLSRLELPKRSPGRPKLGVVPREVTLLPRHWDWLHDQPGGASVTLRKLVDQARQNTVDAERIRKARESACRFLTDMAGDRPGFEEALRALFAGDRARFEQLVDRWPNDIKAHARTLGAEAMPCTT
ncbi:MAG: DUF2239 family protein [Gemmatimonadetes bacterium]|nr:DUF2239 family protein [Gemmatimonadota bacterium]